MSDKIAADVLGLTTKIVAAHLSRNQLSAAALPALIEGVYRSLSTLGTSEAVPIAPGPAVPVKKSVFPDYIVCLEDGKAVEDAQAAPANRLRHDAGRIPGEVGLAGQVPNGRAQLRQPPLRPGEENRSWAQAGRAPGEQS